MFQLTSMIRAAVHLIDAFQVVAATHLDGCTYNREQKKIFEVKRTVEEVLPIVFGEEKITLELDID